MDDEIFFEEELEDLDDIDAEVYYDLNENMDSYYDFNLLDLLEEVESTL